jgi:hypothetical protein
LREFAKILRKQLFGYIGEQTPQEDANFLLSKLDLCNICYFEEYVKTVTKYFLLVNPPKNEYSLEQFFNKPPIQKMSIKYCPFLEN